MSAKALLDQDSNPGENEIKEAIAGNICRCTGYVQIIESIKSLRARDTEHVNVVAWRSEEGIE
ncbi:MAG: hypothetical protein A2V65_05050 [Deltaproteobacteria bacterium RBG_13_49_15]|nr:MAG: hypothetical protein A2V65_05050 [Deltaproteobacteria bacterium RBG_13_49_15]